MYNLYSISKTPEHDILLVRWLRLVSLTILSSGCGYEPHLLRRFLIFYADLTKWSDGLTVARLGIIYLQLSTKSRIESIYSASL
jgi:hypothetical protein